MSKKPKLTPWFPHNIKPVRSGVYEVKFDLLGNDDGGGYAFWDGLRWTNALANVARAHENNDWFEGAVQQKKWRGLTKATGEQA